MSKSPARDHRLRAELDELERFESLLFELSARFVNVPADRIDSEIDGAQRRVCETLRLDASLLWQWTNLPAARLALTHMHRPHGGPPAPTQLDVQAVYPWTYARVLAGNMYVCSTLDDLPPQAARDRETFERYGVKSNVGIPLIVGGGTPLGVLTFHTVREHRQWTESVVKRLQLVARIFAHALERMHADAQARLRLRQLMRLNRASTMGEFATALAHELNQPLGAILRNAEAAEIVLCQDPPDLDELRAIIADIKRDDERAGGVIDRLRALLRQRSVELRTEQLPELVNDVLRYAFADAAARGIRIVNELPADLPAVRCDRIPVQQVLLNLVLNGMDAIGKAAAGGQRVVIRAHDAGGGWVEVSVSDTGGGVEAASIASLFEPLFTTKEHGMGMGLTISRTLVEAHGGRLWVEGGDGAAECGASFHFTLPTATPAEEGP